MQVIRLPMLNVASFDSTDSAGGEGVLNAIALDSATTLRIILASGSGLQAIPLSLLC